MSFRRFFALAGVSAVSILFGLAPIGQAAAQDVRHACSEKYQEAKKAGTLNGEAWPQFYSRCTSEAKGLAPAAEAAPAPLDTRHICSEKYQAAKAAGTLNGEAWPQFYSRCAAETKANPPAGGATAPAPTAAAPPPAPVVAEPAPPPPAPAPAAAPPSVNPLKKPSAKPQAPAAAAITPSTAVFPTAISPVHAAEKPYKARLKTCSDQYRANKAANANGGLKWIQKGGGYWSECNKHLKGEG